MEQEENEETLDTFKGTLMGLLMDSAYIGKTVEKKSNELINKLNKVSDSDDLRINKLEMIGLELINVLKSVKGNTWAIADTLENKSKKLNNTRTERVFDELSTKVLEYKIHRISRGPDNKYISSVPSCKDAQTNFPSVSTDEVKIGRRELDNNNTQEEPSTDHVTLEDCKEKNNGSLSLKKNDDTQDTNDCWIDSMFNRSPSLVEVWHKKYEGRKINATDECMDELKREQEEEELRNRVTPELKYPPSDSDDSFIDGKTPKRETVKQSDSESLVENKEDLGPELSPKLEESFVVEENELIYSCLDTARNKNVVSTEDTDNENSNVSSANTIPNSNTDLSDSEKDKTVEESRSNDKSSDVNLHIKTGTLDTDSGIEVFSKSYNIPLETVDEIVADTDKDVTENVMNVLNETEKSESVKTEKNGSANCELNTDEMEILERGPYSVETVKLDSDTEEVTSTQSTENSYSEIMATQPFSDECINLNVRSDKEGTKILGPNHHTESPNSISTEEIESESIENAEEIISSPILVPQEAMKDTENKDISCNSEMKEKVENTLETILDNYESLKKSISNKDNSSQLLQSENDEIGTDLSNNDLNLNKDSSTNSLLSKDTVDSIHLAESPNSRHSDSKNIDAIVKATDSEQLSNVILPLNCPVSESSALTTSDLADQLQEAPNSQLAEIKESEFNEDKDCAAQQSLKFPNSETLISGKQVSDAKQSSKSSNSQLAHLKEVNLAEDLYLSPSSLTPSGEATNTRLSSSGKQVPDAKQSLESFDPQLSHLKEVNLAEDLYLSQSSLTPSGEASNTRQLPSGKQVPDAKQSSESFDPQLSHLKEVNLAEDLYLSQSSLTPSGEASNTRQLPSDNQVNLAEDLYLSPSSLTPSGEASLKLQLFDTKGDIDINLSTNSPSSKCKEASDSRQLLSSSNNFLKEQNQVPDAKQLLSSPNPQLSDTEVSILDEEKLSIASKVQKSLFPNTVSSLKTQISDDTGVSSLDAERNLSPHSQTSQDIASSSSLSLESPNVTSLENIPNSQKNNLPENSVTSEDKAAETQQSPECFNLKFSNVENLESSENINASTNFLASKDDDSLAIENKTTVAQPSPNPQFSDSETIVIIESDTEQELEVYNSRTVENMKADFKNKNLIVSESQQTETSSFILDIDETSRASKRSLTECNSQYDSDATDILCGNEIKSNKPVVYSGDIDNSVSLNNKVDYDGEENLSQSSNKSFEFDVRDNLEEIAHRDVNFVGENVSLELTDNNKQKTSERDTDMSVIIDSSQDTNDIDQNKVKRSAETNPLILAECENGIEEIDNIVRVDEIDNTPLKDIVEDLEAVLSQQNDNEGIDNDSDATISDIDYKDAKSLNVQFSSDEFNSIGKNETDALKTNITKSEGVKETIEVSDSDDEVHLDVTMEEILSDGSSNEQSVRKSDVEKKEDIPEIKPECISPTDNVPENEIIDEDLPRNEVGDELLELLREVEVPAISDVASSNKSKQLLKKKEAKDADEIFKMLQEDSSLEISDSDLSEEELNWNSIELESESSESGDDENYVKKPDVVDDNNQELLDKYGIKKCCVRIERLQINEQDVVLVNKTMNDSIDRLCDINSIISKRKYSPAELQEKSKTKKFKKAHKSTTKGTSDTESFSDISNSDTDNELHNDQTHSPILAAPIAQKLDDLLANEICNALKSNSGTESDDESDDSRKSSKKKKIGNGEISDNAKASKQILSKEENEKKAWKNDPLLRGKLDSDSSTSTGSEKSVKKRNLKSKYEHDTDFNIISDGDTDSDCSEVYQQNKAWLEEKLLISPIKKNLPLSDSTDSDSDCEFVPQRQSPQKSPNDDEAGPSASQKGRRNIRALMSDEKLAEATQKANKEEQERIERLEDRYKVQESLSQSLSQTDDEDLLILDVDEELKKPLITVHWKLTRRLKPHQREGIKFMWDSCYESVERLKKHDGSGCILAHCMGLGKTRQVITLIHTLFSYDVTNTKHVLVVCPLSTVNNWKNEIKIAFNGMDDEMFRVITAGDRRELSKKYELVKKWRLRKKCVLVLGYDGFETITNEAKLEKGGRYIKQRMLEALVDPGPDLVICDEGHLLRNKKAQKTLALDKIRTKRRIVLTGTPLQNNLLEYYFMVQFVKPNLLGNLKEFKTNFVNPITNGQYEDSTELDINLMLKRTHVLHKLLKKTIQRIEDTELKIYLPKMVDHAVFIQLHPVQVELYHKFLEIIRQKTAENPNKRGFLSDFYVFQYIGTHPHLLTVVDGMRNKKIKERDLITNENENDNPICNIDGWWKAKIPEDASEKIEYGNKLMMVKSIIEECEEIGDKVLIFSQYLGELELIEHFLKNVGTAKCSSWRKKLDYFRMDGTVLPEDRTIICDKFNEKGNTKMRLLLMSTKVGGLGLNLTAANRVIIMTVSWNPSFDTQSVFRVYRFGQEKAVYIYRLISLDTMEEIVYQRTVTKLAVAHRVVDKHQIKRHYKGVDLQELYTRKPDADVVRPTPNVPEDKILAKLILKLPFIFKYHEHQALLANRPEDNLNEQELNAAWDEFKKIKDAPPIPPPPVSLPALPQFPPASGPTYSHAYSLMNMVRNRATTEVNEDNLVQYYIPTTSNPSNVQQKNDRPAVNQMKTNIEHKNMNPNTVQRKISTPSDTVITLIDDPISEMIPIPANNVSNKGSNVEQDPLYISGMSRVGKTNGHYGQVMAYFSRKKLPIPKLPPSTSVLIEDESPNKSNQKENGEVIRASKLSNVSITVEDNGNGRRKTKVPKEVLTENKSAVNKNKRKRLPSNLVENVVKKMKGKFNKTNSPISLDDDAEVTDTTSESGSLSNEIIQNLGRSGITVHKVMNDSNRNNDIITLD